MVEKSTKKQDWYESIALTELQIWLAKTKKKPSLMNRITKGTQRKINQLIPEKIHLAITYAIEKMVKGVLFGSKYLTSYPKAEDELWAIEKKAKKILKIYQKTASVEGAVTGAGGILLGLADFPAFLSIKMKMLFQLANAYGHNVMDFKERLFILYIFKLTFSSQKTRNETIEIMEDWDTFSQNISEDIESFDWRNFQLEYRDYMDLAKLAQLLPIIGAPVGAIANYKLTAQLGEMAINCYRLRYFLNKND